MTDIQQAVSSARSASRRFHAYSARHLDMLAQRAGPPPDERLAVRPVAAVLPFRTNSFVVEDLIDWDAAPDDPIYRFAFLKPDMFPAADVLRLSYLLCASDSRAGPQNMRPGVAAGLADEDELLGRLLMTGGMLATGRTLRADVPPQLLAEEEPITFLADEQTTMARVVAAGPTSHGDVR